MEALSALVFCLLVANLEAKAGEPPPPGGLVDNGIREDIRIKPLDGGDAKKGSVTPRKEAELPDYDGHSSGKKDLDANDGKGVVPKKGVEEDERSADPGTSRVSGRKGVEEDETEAKKTSRVSGRKGVGQEPPTSTKANVEKGMKLSQGEMSKAPGGASSAPKGGRPFLNVTNEVKLVTGAGEKENSKGIPSSPAAHPKPYKASDKGGAKASSKGNGSTSGRGTSFAAIAGIAFGVAILSPLIYVGFKRLDGIRRHREYRKMNDFLFEGIPNGA